MICNNCGSALPENAKFCPNCGKNVENNNENDNISLTAKERLSLFLQIKTLQKISDESEFDFYQKMLDILNKGFSFNYIDVFNDNINLEEVPLTTCKFVLDVLDMYRCIIYSYQKLKNNNCSLKDSDVAFPGFDGNNQWNHLAFARFFIYDLNRYEEIQDIDHTDRLNSHDILSCNKYENMLKKLNEYKNSNVDIYSMTETQLNELIKTI